MLLCYLETVPFFNSKHKHLFCERVYNILITRIVEKSLLFNLELLLLPL